MFVSDPSGNALEFKAFARDDQSSRVPSTPPKGVRRARGALDARDRLGHGLDGHGHVMGIGVDEALGVQHHADVAPPEDQVARGEVLAATGRPAPPADRRLADRPGRPQKRLLDEPGAIQPETVRPAPDVGRAEEQTAPLRWAR